MKPLKVTENWVQVFWKTNKIQTDLEELEKLDGNNKMKCNRDKFKILHLRSKTQMKKDKKQPGLSSSSCKNTLESQWLEKRRKQQWDETAKKANTTYIVRGSAVSKSFCFGQTPIRVPDFEKDSLKFLPWKAIRGIKMKSSEENLKELGAYKSPNGLMIILSNTQKMSLVRRLTPVLHWLRLFNTEKCIYIA